MNGHVSSVFSGICWPFYEWLVPRVGDRHLAVFERIVEGMALHEVDDLRSFLDSTRRFILDPKNPVPRPSAAVLAALGAGSDAR
jgi:hypothetical protein